MPEIPTSDVRLLAPAQVAEILGVSVDEVMALVEQARLRGMRVGLPCALAGRRGERRGLPRRAGRGGPAHRAVASVERGQLPRAVGHRRRPQRGLNRRCVAGVTPASRRNRARIQATAANGTMRWPVTVAGPSRRSRLVQREVEVIRAGAIDRAGEHSSATSGAPRPRPDGARGRAGRSRSVIRSASADRARRRARAAQQVGVRHPDRRDRCERHDQRRRLRPPSSATQSAPTPVTSADRTVPSESSNEGGAPSRSRSTSMASRSRSATRDRRRRSASVSSAARSASHSEAS